MELIGDDGLPAIVDVHVLHRLLLMQSCQGLDSAPRRHLCLQGGVHVPFSSDWVLDKPKKHAVAWEHSAKLCQLSLGCSILLYSPKTASAASSRLPLYAGRRYLRGLRAHARFRRYLRKYPPRKAHLRGLRPMQTRPVCVRHGHDVLQHRVIAGQDCVVEPAHLVLVQEAYRQCVR